MNSLLNPILAAPKLKFTDPINLVDIWRDVMPVKVEIHQPVSGATKPLATKDFTKEQIYTEVLQKDLATTRVLQPIRMRITSIISNLSTMEDIINRFKDESSSFDISSRGLIAVNMILTSIEIQQSKEKLNAVDVIMEFEQFAPYEPDPFDPVDPENESTFGIHVQELKDSVTNRFGELRESVTSGAKNLYNKVFPAA